MSIYRCYYLDSADRIASTDVIYCDTDAEARSRADALLGKDGCLQCYRTQFDLVICD